MTASAVPIDRERAEKEVLTPIQYTIFCCVSAFPYSAASASVAVSTGISVVAGSFHPFWETVLVLLNLMLKIDSLERFCTDFIVLRPASHE